MRYPDFIIIGATKGGTSWIVANLQLQEDVSIPMQPSAGVHYFSRNFERGTDWYLKHFSGISDEIRFVGEKSASYLPHPDVPARLKELLPHARLIAQLRNPVDRAYSDYCMHFRRGQASGDIERYLDPDRTPIPRLLNDGRYHTHLTRYLDFFPPDQVLVTIYEEMERDPAGVLRSISRHVGVDDPVIPQDIGKRAKARDTAMLPLGVRRLLGPMKGVVAPFRHTSAFKSARALLAKPNRYPPLTEPIRARLAAYFQPETERLARLLGRDLDEWRRVDSSNAA
ncbi:sulfotransferase domain-containing protein [Stappia sediminis]|uniref:sulfotransferase domain-containing protein n=1 Tax=Stappia sediminis TaxID=2692190 RepID=UPI0028AC006C|nr:sulfotransferase domain-containing protein [Stappia sediminis]